MKTVIIGANHAGIAAANTLLDNYPEQKVVMIDRNSNLSYLGCGTALWVGKQRGFRGKGSRYPHGDYSEKNRF